MISSSISLKNIIASNNRVSTSGSFIDLISCDLNIESANFYNNINGVLL